MKLRQPFLALFTCAASIAAGADFHHHHHNQAAAAPGVMQMGTNTGNVLGQQLNQQGNYDTTNRTIINNTTNNALDNSAVIDGMLAADAIAPDGWLALKAAMANSMDQASNDQQINPELPSAVANGGEANGNGQTGFQDQTAPMDNSGLTASAAPVAPAGPVAAAPTEAKSSSGSGGAAPAPLFSGFIIPIGPSANGASISGSVPSEKGQEVSALKNSAVAPPSGAASVSLSGIATSPTSTGDQRILRFAQALSAKRSGDLATGSHQAKKKMGFPDPLKVLFGRSKTKYANTRGLSAMEVNNSPNQVLDLPSNTAALSFAEEAEDEDSNWTLLFLMTMGFFAAATALYIAARRPKKSTLQLMVPSEGEHFAIRPSTQAGEYILDIKDARGKLVRSAGMLRPHSVARAAVLPPALAAKLGAEGSFDRFEFTQNGEFRPTEKEEGYQIFPFILD